MTLAAATGAVALGGRPLLAAHAQVSDGVALDDLPLDLLVGCIAALALACCVLWLVAVTTATAIEAVTGASLTAVRAMSPAVVRRLVLVCCGAAIGGTSVLSPAAAVGGDGRPPSVTRVTDVGEVPESQKATMRRTGATASTRSALSGLALPDRTEGSAPSRHETKVHSLRGPRDTEPMRFAAGEKASQQPGRHRRSTRSWEPSGPRATARAAVVTAASEPVGAASVAEPGPERTHRVRVGESLWSIAERLLPHATPSRLDALWRRIYRLNDREVGTDPDLIIPGTTLLLPPASSQPPNQPHLRPGDGGATAQRKDAS